MPNFLDNFKTSHTLHKVIPAADFNRVRLALLRISNPLEITLTSMNCLEVTFTDEYWLCFDACMNNQPILAWTAFDKSGHNNALNSTVACELRMYHAHAGLVMGEVLENIGKELDDQMGSL